MVFFLLRGGGVSANPKNPYQKILGLFWLILTKGGGVSANPKNPYQKKLRWSKKGEGGVSVFWLKVIKNQFFLFWPLPLGQKSKFGRKFFWKDPLIQIIQDQINLKLILLCTTCIHWHMCLGNLRIMRPLNVYSVFTLDSVACQTGSMSAERKLDLYFGFFGASSLC